MQHAASTIEHAASTKVQNLYRGKLARKALALERSAATRVQAMYRGQLARGAMVLQRSTSTKAEEERLRAEGKYYGAGEGPPLDELFEIGVFSLYARPSGYPSVLDFARSFKKTALAF